MKIIKELIENAYYYTRFYIKAYFTNYFNTPKLLTIGKYDTSYLAFHSNFDLESTIDWDVWMPSERWGNIKDKVIFKDSQDSIENGSAVLTSDINLVENEPSVKTGGLYSWDSFNTKYGYFEASIKVPPKGYKYWPAFWLTSLESWPPEIDIFELMGSDSSYFTMTLHWLGSKNKHQQKGRRLKFPGTDFLSKDYHLYAVDWQQDKITWYIDNLPVYTLTNHIPELDMFILLNNNYTGDTLENDLPMSMNCEYIACYKKN